MDLLSVGIDVSKETLHVCLRVKNKEESIIVPNTKNGIKALIRSLQSKRCQCKVLMESTGRYHLLCAFLMSEQGFDVRVVNPIAAKRYISASIRKKKTDKADAAALADMALVHQSLPRTYHASKTDIQIRQKMGLLCSLEKQCVSLRLMMKNYQEFQETMSYMNSPCEQGIQQTISDLNTERKKLEKEIESLILRSETKQKQHILATSIPGMSSYCASLCCQMLDIDCRSAKQWIAFLGLDIPPRESGTWRGRSKLSKRGNPYLRKRLFSAAWGAAMNNAEFKAYYQYLKEQGKHHNTALVIIARKLLTILFAVLKNQRPYDVSFTSFTM